jgi:hypothetical protein
MTTARHQLDLAMTEAQWQTTVIDLAYAHHWRVYHTFDSRRSYPGFPDLVLVRDRIIYAELKSEKGRVTLTQQEWIDDLNGAGGEAHIWRPSDFDEVKQILRGLRGEP